jgi:topoisomerase IA-like protein
MYEIDPTRLDLAEEFRKKPYGRHSAELQRILNRMRTEPFDGHYVLLRDGRFGPYRLGRLSKRAGSRMDRLQAALETTDRPGLAAGLSPC